MEALLKNDQTARQYTVAELVELYGDAVYKTCCRLTFSRESADDLFQETFLQAFEKLRKISTSKNPQSFLLSMTIYIWKSWNRKYARRNRLAPVVALNESVPDRISVEERLLEQEEIRIVRKLVETLPEKLKIPVILYYSLEMKVPEIAASLGIPAGTVKSRLFKARKIIEKGFEQHENKY